MAKNTNHTLFFQKFVLGLFGSLFVITAIISTLIHLPIKTSPAKSSDSKSSVLASTTQSLKGFLTVNVPAHFNNDLILKNGLEAEGATFKGDVTVEGRISASNLTNNLSAGEGITVTNGLTPKIENSGVLSLQGKTGVVTFEAGSGISISGMKISSTTSTSSFATFKNVVVGSSVLVAADASDNLTLAAGTGTTLTTDTSTKTVTISVDTSTGGGWTDSGSNIYLTSNTDNVGIGTSTPSTTLDITGTLNTSGAVTFGSTLGVTGTASLNGGATIPSGQNLTLSGNLASNLVPSADLTYNLGSASLRFGTIYASSVIGGTSGTLGYWQKNDGVISPSISIDDFAIGGSSTSSALFQVFGSGANAGNVNIKGSTTLGDAIASDVVTFNSRIGSSIEPTTGSLYDVGSSARRWATIWGDTANFTNIVTDSISVSGTTSNDFTINSDYGLDDLETGTLSFERGSPAVNAQLKWNATGTPSKLFSLNAPLLINQDAGIPDSGTAALIVNQIQNQDIFSASSGGITKFTIDNSGNLNVTGNLSLSGSLLTTGTTGSNGWIQRNLGVVSPSNITDDLAIGGSSSSSAKLLVSGTTGALQLMGSSNTISTQVLGAWTMNSNGFSYRRIMTVSNNDGSTTLPQNHQVTMSFTGDNAADVCSNTRSDSNDIRVAYNTTEIARNITRNCPTSIDVSFQLQASVAPSTSTSVYYLYYSNSSLASAGSTYTYTSLQVDSADGVGTWTSSDGVNTPISQDTNTKTEGTGSIKLSTTGSTVGDTGSGADGAFDASVCTGTGLSLVSSTCTVATATKSTFNFTTITIPSGYTVTATGTNPIVFKATGAVSIAGTGKINLNGANSTGAGGGAGIAGGGNGGGGSFAGGAPAPGTVGSGTGGGGVGGSNGGGGGGGGHGGAGGEGGGASVPAGGSTYDTDPSGGSGGGGGAGGFGSSGSGGGGGGGGISIQSASTITIEASASITANGGNTASSSCGSGGGGSGGRIQLYSASSISLSGTLNANGGNGNTGTCNDGEIYHGGGGGGGRIIMYDVDGSVVGGTRTVTGGTKGGNGAANGSAGVVTVTTLSLPSQNDTITKTVSSTDLSTKGSLAVWVRSDTAGQVATLGFGESAFTEQTTALTVNSANTWEQKSFDISGITGTSKDAVTKVGFRVDGSSSFNFWFDNLQASPSAFAGTSPTVTSGNKILGANNLSINSQGTGAINLNYDPSSGLAGSGGFNIYNGAAGFLFGVTSTGDASASGALYLTGASASAGLNILNGQNFSIKTSVGGDAGLTTRFTILNNGNIGIGNTNPGSALDIWGNSGTTSIASISGNTSFASLVVNNNSTRGDLFTASSSGRTRLVLTNAGNLGVGTATPSSRLQVGDQGDGTVAKANAWNVFSDIRFKENVNTISDSLGKVMALNGVSFNWINSGLASIGFIAQEVEKIVPEIVTTDSYGFKSLDYGKITPLLVNAIHEQQGQISSLSAKLDKLGSLNFIPYPATGSSDMVIIKDSLLVLGTTTVTDLSVGNSLSVGNTMQIGENSINTIGQNLEIQPLRQGDINFMGGLATIDTGGNLTVKGDITAENINAKNVLSAQSLNIDSADTPVYVSPTEVNTTKSAGMLTIKAGETTLKVNNFRAKTASLIFITARESLQGQGVFVEKQTDGSFNISLDYALSKDIILNYIIINSN